MKILPVKQSLFWALSTCSYSDSQKDLIKKQLAKVSSLMNEGNKSDLQPIEKVNEQKKIEPQVRFYSTKKKSNQQKSYSKTFNKQS